MELTDLQLAKILNLIMEQYSQQREQEIQKLNKLQEEK